VTTKVAWVGVWCLVGSALVVSQGGSKPAAEPVAPNIPGVVAGGTKVETIQTWEPGIGGEGPVGMPDGTVVFTQQGRHRLMKIDANGALSVFLDLGMNQVLGQALDQKGRLLTTHRGNPNGVVAVWPTRTVIAEQVGGKKFGRPNDIVADAKGGVYFSDNSGVREGQPPPDPNWASPGIYYINPSGQVMLVSKGRSDCPPTCTAVERPNGLQLSPDGKVLYAASGMVSYISAWDVAPDGRLSNPRNYANLGPAPTGADGMATDAAGRLYVAAKEVRVFSPQGQLLGSIPTPKPASNLTFAGPGKRTLYVTSNQGGAYKIAMLAEGPKNRAK
jgi:gluconolactonase